MLGDAKVAAALVDPDATDLPDKVKAALRLLTKVTRDHAGLTAADFKPLLAAGVSREGVIEALMVGYAFNVITRMADAFAWDVPGADSFAASAKMLLGRGYK